MSLLIYNRNMLNNTQGVFRERVESLLNDWSDWCKVIFRHGPALYHAGLCEKFCGFMAISFSGSCLKALSWCRRSQEIGCMFSLQHSCRAFRWLSSNLFISVQLYKRNN